MCPTMKVTVAVLLVICKLCWTIRVPVTWDEGESEVNNKNENEFSVESSKDNSDAEFESQHSSEAVQPAKRPVPVEYFEYTAKKPQFAIDVAEFHGVQSPENHYKAYPIKPYTRKVRPELGKHQIFDSSNTLHKPFQDFTKVSDISHATPVLSTYEILHPYKAETPALQEIYRDPVLTKIRHDLENSKNRLQSYEKDAGKSDIVKNEYLESPQETDEKLFPHRHRPAPFEIHHPQRRPIYYRPVPVYKSREQYLNHRLRHPWNHNIAKVRPMHYRPLQNHIQQLRQGHALKYDDERNEYPQVKILENYSDPKDGYDIYEKGRDKFVHLRNNVDESINDAAKENRLPTYKTLEFQNDDSDTNNDDNDEEFVPIKNYAQVRKTETFRHFPRAAALEDAETYDEIKNAPRLREAVKSTKAQTVYSEEGYEDAAYDHAGEQKHASENEGHGGFLKENELSGGKYKTPSINANYKDSEGSVFRDQAIHANKWKDDKKDINDEKHEEDYSEDEHEHLLEVDNHQTEPINEDNSRNKRDSIKENKNQSISTFQNKNTHEVDKREANFEVPLVDLNSTFFKESDYLNNAKFKLVPKLDIIKQKYPYYFKNLKTINKNSPLKYAENMKLIPKKTPGGTEFYDSRSKFECPDVDDVPDPVPEKLKNDGHPDLNSDGTENESSEKGDINFDTTKKQPRLKGLGDKIDCFKAKYFGENPLDSPFFREEIISSPEPIIVPIIGTYKLKIPSQLEQTEEQVAESNVRRNVEKLQENNSSDLFNLIEKLRNDQNLFQKSSFNSNGNLLYSLDVPNNKSYLNSSQSDDQSSVYNDVIKNIKNSLNLESIDNLENTPEVSSIFNDSMPAKNITYTSFQNKEDVTKLPLSRKKRATPFVYEPYKIIRDVSIQDDARKNLATSNVSPLIRRFQSSILIDKPIYQNPINTQHAKRNVNTYSYKDIGREDREPKIKYGSSKNEKNLEDSKIVDISVGKLRGEPRYEIQHVNHKPRYKPVTNKKSISQEDYEAQTSNSNESTIKKDHKTPTSTTLQKTITTTTSTIKPEVFLKHRQTQEKVKDEDYEEYDDDEEYEEKLYTTSTTTTTTTLKPAFRRKTRIKTSIQEPVEYQEEPKLKLVTRFRNYEPKNDLDIKKQHLQHTEEHNDEPNKKGISTFNGNITPNIREKKKKISKSTLVTDTKKYGDTSDDNDEILKDEVDALIGVNHNMDDFVTNYKNDKAKSNRKINEEINKGIANKASDFDDDEEKQEDDEIDENGNEDDDDDDEFDDDDDDDNSDDDDDYDDGIEDDDDDDIINEDVFTEKNPKITTPEPTKRTLVITTDAPIPTTASRSAKLKNKPVITRKKLEIHKELPVNKTSPHISQFKQDIKEIEIIKETRNPLKRRPNKNVEVLDLYKDVNLAKNINNLGVEIFKENLDLRQGPKHGGNYKSAEPSTESAVKKQKHVKDDTLASQSEYNKQIDTDDNIYLNDGLKFTRGQRLRNKGTSSPSLELSDIPNKAMHGGNLNYGGGSRKNVKNQKLIELDDENDHDTSTDSREEKSYSSSRRENPMHGGNYRSAKIIEDKQHDTIQPSRVLSKDTRRNAALILNTFVQAAPVLTSTPGYIKDPSKRKYYYVDV